MEEVVRYPGMKPHKQHLLTLISMLMFQSYGGSS